MTVEQSFLKLIIMLPLRIMKIIPKIKLKPLIAFGTDNKLRPGLKHENLKQQQQLNERLNQTIKQLKTISFLFYTESETVITSSTSETHRRSKSTR